MSKKRNKFRQQYDEYDESEEDYFHKKTKKKKKETIDDFLTETDILKRKANNRYLNKKKNKNKDYNLDNWN